MRDGARGRLLYRGYPIGQLVAKGTYAEGADLLFADAAANTLTLVHNASTKPSPVQVPSAALLMTPASLGVSQNGHARTLTIRFWLRPVEITGDERVTGLVLERTRLGENGAFLTGFRDRARDVSERDR